MITIKELNPKNYPLDEETKKNIDDLFDKINKIRTKYGKPMRVTSGLRSQSDQQRINPSAPKSRHITGQAVDISDPDGELWKWLMINMDFVVEIGLWLEDKAATPTWVHLQSVPPKSGRRIFKP